MALSYFSGCPVQYRLSERHTFARENTTKWFNAKRRKFADELAVDVFASMAETLMDLDYAI